MDRGGIHDHVGGGFHRYAVDDEWRVPHFEKMLYDNALLVSLLLRGASRGLLGAEARSAAGAALEWMGDTLGREDGALAGSQDADDPVGEGHASTWTARELREALGPALGAAVARAWQVGDFGPAEGRSLLRRTPEDHGARAILSTARRRLRELREARPQPPVHDQAVVSWNALAAVAFVEGATLLGHRPALARATRIGSRLLRAWDGQRLPRTLAPDAPEGVLDDYGATLLAMLALHRATGARRWMAAALELATAVHEGFLDPDGRLRHTRARGLLPALVVRPEDTAEPSGWGLALLGLQQLHALGQALPLDPLLTAAAGAPESASTLHRALLRATRPHRSLVIAGAPEDPRTQALLEAAWRPWRPGLAVLVVDPADPGPLAALEATAGRLHAGPPRAYRCTGAACALPTADPEELRRWVAEGA